MSKPIFISHSVADKDIADKVVDLLSVAMEIDVTSNVFCSSLEGLKIPAGKDFKQFIKEQIQTPKIVILLISQNYLASQFCLAEAGASWAMSHRIIPFLIPPVKFDDMKAVLAGVNALKIEDSSDWNECLHIFKEVLNINPNVNRWERKRNEKVGEILPLISMQPMPSLISFEKFQEVEAKLKGANEEIVGLEEKCASQEKLIIEIRKAKDAKEVASIELANLPVAVAFQELVNIASSHLDEFRGEIYEAFYYYFRGEGLPAPQPGYTDTDSRRNDVRDAVENGFLLQDRDGEVELNANDPAIRETIQALSNVRDFIENNPDLAEPYEADHRHQLEFTSRRFWEVNF